MDHELSRVVDPLPAPPADRHLRSFRIVSLVVAGIIVSSGTNGAQNIPALGIPNEVHQILGDGVVGAAEPVRSLSDPVRIAHWQPGEWTYRITAGERGGQMEREILAPIDATARGETWTRTIGKPVRRGRSSGRTSDQPEQPDQGGSGCESPSSAEPTLPYRP